MSKMASQQSQVGPETLIVIKVTVNEASIRKFKFPLKDLGAGVLLTKLRKCLDIQPDDTVVFERFSDSAGGFVVLDPNNSAVFKTLIRAAKAKLKLRLKATVTSPSTVQPTPDIKQEAVIPVAMEPVIVRSNPTSRDSTALDRRSVGSGIFQFREARAYQQTLVNEEAPTGPVVASQPAPAVQPQQAQITLPIRTQAPAPSPAIITTIQGRPWSVYCNECDKPIGDGHFHCSICDGGDYDLCEDCVGGGKLCPGEGHWLIKRFIKDGTVINSTTERISPRSARLPQPEKVEAPKPVPGAFTTFVDESKSHSFAQSSATRTCNNCVVVLHEDSFVTCTDCDDFDLCLSCHESNQHGHHPAHGFERATQRTALSMLAISQLAPGRNVRHEAVCDGCDTPIYGVRHKCLNCPDWDFCRKCIRDAGITHPRHRFAPLYEPIGLMPQLVRHFGIYCDGPLCKGKEQQCYIKGDRYKCAVCHDMDFCANCEAHPSNHHNRTHPMIMFKTPVNNVKVSTENEDLTGNVRVMGDRHATPTAPTKPASQTPAPPQMETTKCQTVADIKPFIEEKKNIVNIPVKGPKEASTAPVVLNAHFKQDSIADGTSMVAGSRFTQIWTLRNPGPHAWPAGCSVRYVGGDNMLNVDNAHPVPSADVASATESNVVGREVQVGEDIAFKVTLKAPQRVGKAISYWRLKSPDGTPFGHRLWCDIDVKKAETWKPALPETAEVLAYLDEFDRELKFHLQRKKSARLSSPPDYNSVSNDALGLNRESMRTEQELRQQQVRKSMLAEYERGQLERSQQELRQQQRREAMLRQVQARGFTAPGIKREEADIYRRNMDPAAGPSMTGRSTTEDDRVRKEVAKQRMEVIKAKIMKSREERAKMLEARFGEEHAKMAVREQVQLERGAARNAEKAAEQKKTADEEQKVQKIIDAVLDGTKQEVEHQEGSLMVFPRLDKESPESSTYQSATSSRGQGKAAWVEDEDGEVERTANRPASISQPDAATPAVDDFEDLTDEIEVLSAGSEESDDGFLTDEEYDILDASDRETVASP